jgi:hypothetical protein
VVGAPNHVVSASASPAVLDILRNGRRDPVPARAGLILSALESAGCQT